MKEVSQLRGNSHLGKTNLKQSETFSPQGQGREEWGSLAVSSTCRIDVIKKRGAC